MYIYATTGVICIFSSPLGSETVWSSKFSLAQSGYRPGNILGNIQVSLCKIQTPRDSHNDWLRFRPEGGMLSSPIIS